MTSISSVLSYLSRVCGFDTVDSFPPGHAYARTHWDRAYFDIASDLKPEQIERSLCSAIGNTPAIFAHISSPTPRMQRALLSVIEERVRRGSGNAGELVALLVAAYHSPYTMDAVPGLRAAIADLAGEPPAERARLILAFLSRMPAAFDVIDA